jgi:hypothetical protein
MTAALQNYHARMQRVRRVTSTGIWTTSGPLALSRFAIFSTMSALGPNLFAGLLANQPQGIEPQSGWLRFSALDP